MLNAVAIHDQNRFFEHHIIVVPISTVIMMKAFIVVALLLLSLTTLRSSNAWIVDILVSHQSIRRRACVLNAAVGIFYGTSVSKAHIFYFQIFSFIPSNQLRAFICFRNILRRMMLRNITSFSFTRQVIRKTVPIKSLQHSVVM